VDTSEIGIPTIATARTPFPPGPKGHFLAATLLTPGADHFDTLGKWAREFGDIFSFRIFGFRFCYLTHPRFIEDVLVTHNQSFIKGAGMRLVPRLFGQGLLTSEGKLWHRQRQLLQPAFHRRSIGGYARVMVECTQEMLAGWRNGEVRDFHDEVSRLALETASRVLFHLDFRSHVEQLQKVARAVYERTSLNPVLVYATRYLPTPGNLRYLWRVERLRKIVYSVISKRRTSGQSSDDVLSLLLQMRDENGQPMNDGQVRDELLTLICTATDTTALVLSYAWYLLAHHPEAEAKMMNEIRAVLGDRPVELEDLPRLSYTQQVIREAMRLYPPGWILCREAVEDFEIGGYRLPAGTNFLMPAWIVHRDPRFYDRPDEFLPERWTEEFERQLPKFAYFPFGGGQRTCIGAAFGNMQISLVLATIAQRFRCRLASGFELKLVPAMTLQPEHGVSVVIERR
jgi:cytochrome P450